MLDDHPRVQEADARLAAVEVLRQKILAEAAEQGKANEAVVEQWRIERSKALAAGRLPPPPPGFEDSMVPEVLQELNRDRSLAERERLKVLAEVRPEIEMQGREAIAELLVEARPLVEALHEMSRRMGAVRAEVRQVRSASDRCSEERRTPGDAERTGGRVTPSEVIDLVQNGTDLLALARLDPPRSVVQADHGQATPRYPFGRPPDMTPLRPVRPAEI